VKLYWDILHRALAKFRALLAAPLVPAIATPTATSSYKNIVSTYDNYNCCSQHLAFSTLAIATPTATNSYNGINYNSFNQHPPATCIRLFK